MTQRFTEKQLLESFDLPESDPGKRSVRYLIFQEGSDKPLLNKMDGDHCFSSLFHISVGVPCDVFFLSFFPWMWERNGAEKWVDWVVNESFFSDVFFTKDVEVWREYGGFIRTDVPRHMMEGAVTFLREAFDEWVWNWSDFVEMGYTPTEAYALARNVSKSEKGFLSSPHHNSNHTLIRRARPLGRYGFDYVEPSNDFLSVGYKHDRRSLSEHHFDTNAHPYWDLIFKFPHKEEYIDPTWGTKSYLYPATKENLDYVLTTLKNLE